ncbi:MAG: cyclic nucleotide-binding domain-containing protein [bacterium]
MGFLDWFFRTGSWVEEETFQLLKNTPIFRDLRSSDYRKLADLLHESHYQEGERVFSEGDPSSAIYIARQGSVRLFREDATGNRVELHTISEGDFFGELALCRGIERSSSAEAKTELTLMGIFRQELEEFIQKEPQSGLAIYRNIVQVLGQRLYNSNDQLESITTELEMMREMNEQQEAKSDSG